ncbi:MAG: hypothetical protein M1820_006590 [Bogoriella megaspora]|nr:MAG: hypothetical protein M1820_006590 [Bogoriella megaspora]
MKTTVAVTLASVLPALAIPLDAPLGKRACSTPPTTVTINNSKLPDPFTFVSGAKVTTKADWACRQSEISSLIQNMELGVKPAKPSSVTGSISGTTLSITASDGGNSINFTPSIKYPTSGTAPYPAWIGFGGGSLPVPSGVALINFNNDDIGAQNDQSSRGKGKFFTLYPNSTAGAMTAWAWGVSRIIDVLESLDVSQSKIDPTRIAVTGCSRNGKGALVAGALDDRITLTLPQESGSGGSACWRLSDYENNGSTTQAAGEIVQENVWFASQFNQYAQSPATVDTLPYDHHLLAGLVAPRALLSIDNVGYEWLGPTSIYGCTQTANKIWQALGVADHMGESQAANHPHCSFPAEQKADLDAFVQKFLFGQNSTNTDFVKTADFSSNGKPWDPTQWVNWTTPTLT